MATTRKRKEEKPVLAICYDFDKTLSPDDMQAQGYIQSVGYEVGDFWDMSNATAGSNGMDMNLAYMLLMKQEAEGKVLFTREKLAEYGAQVKLFPGVQDWFGRIREYGASHGVIVEHYIISSGLKEMIEGTPIAEEFEQIYASSFYYNERGVAIWPAQAINYTNKTQFLFRIEKGILDVNDLDVNEYFAPEDLRVPFRNIVYIGDSATDIPCMKLVNVNGGHSIGVYNNDTLDKSKVYKMLDDKRIKYFAPADYCDGAKLDQLVKAIIDRTAYNEALEDFHVKCKQERDLANRNECADEDTPKRLSLITTLDRSKTFATTHSIIAEMLPISGWSADEIDMLLDIAINNHPVRYLLNDTDVRLFYRNILKQIPKQTEKTQKLTSYFEEK